jgi:hypothetical protein
MPRFNRQFIDDTAKRFTGLPVDKKPLWGRMSPPQMYAHIITSVRYSLGKEPLTPNEGGWFGHYIAAPLLLNGFLKMPKNVKAPKMYDTQAPEGDLATLIAELNEYLKSLETPAFVAPVHPYFGDVGARGWAKVHFIHINHHATQFGV